MTVTWKVKINIEFPIIFILLCFCFLKFRSLNFRCLGVLYSFCHSEKAKVNLLQLQNALMEEQKINDHGKEY